MILHPNDVLLFQGDSITDCGRGREDDCNLGDGYVSIIADILSIEYPELKLRILNRGISGNRAINLVERWQSDCLDLKPNIVSIMIGINDTWRRYDKNDPTSIESYCESYRKILKQTRNIGAKLVLIEPFVLPYPADRISWREDLDPRIEAVRDFAKEFDATLIPLDRIMAEAALKQPPEYWAYDGVHPTEEGHNLIAKAWMDKILST